MSASLHSADIEIPVGREDDLDSAYGDEYASSTASISESIREYRKLANRTYQNYKESDYWGPNDEKQNEQLDILHHMLTLLLDNKLFLAPIEKPQKVLDVGTGTGIWAIDFADQFPSAEVIGTDLSDIMPSFVPPNCRFEIDDAELDWTFKPETFDFVHLRYMLGTMADWPRLYSQAMRTLKPGGYIEHFELSVVFECDDGTLLEDSPLVRWAPSQMEAAKRMGKPFGIYETLKRDIIAAGFEGVQEHKFKLPVGPWSSDKKMKEIGLWNLFFFLKDIEGFTLYLLCKFMGWTHTEVQVWVAQITAAIKDPRTHTYYKATVVYGRKPLSATE